MIELEASPIFIMSSERSGSNLLRSLLSNHSRIAGPVATQLLPLFHNLSPYYGPLTQRDNALILLEDMASLVNHPYYNWKLPVDVVDLYERHQPQQFLDFFTVFYQEKQRQVGKRRFVCKENDLFMFAFALKRYYGECKFIYLYRDPRDYAASITKIPAGPNTVYSAALRWSREQEKCNVLLNTFNLTAHEVSYEALVSDTVQVMTNLLRFLAEPVEAACFQVQTVNNQDLSWNVAWKNLSQPVMKSNFGKYRENFNKNTIRMIETVAQEPMLRLGYTFDTRANWKRPRYYQVRNFMASRINSIKEWRANRKTAERLANRNALIHAIRQKRKSQWRSLRTQ